jgi:hypothetical protein
MTGCNARRQAVPFSGNVIVRDTATKADVHLDFRPGEMPIEGDLGRFQTHVFVAAVEQLA